MKTFVRAVSILVLSSCLLAACGHAYVAPPEYPKPHNLTAVAATTSFEVSTIYQCTASTGYQVVFTHGKWIVSVLSHGGKIWVKPHSPLDTSGTLPTTPIPAGGTAAPGWIRMADGDTATWGLESATAATESPPPLYTQLNDQVAFVDVWCESGATDVVVTSH